MADITKMYGDQIKVTQLYYVRAAAELGSFSQAAAAVGVTQPALSHGIAALERSLGEALFDRSTIGVVPTALARRILPHLHNVLGSLESLLVEARSVTGRNAEPLRVGVSPLIHPELVARAFQAARQHAPAALVLQEDNLVDLRTALLSRQLDLILVPADTPAAGCSRRAIDSEPLHFLPGSGLPVAEADQPIALGDLSGEPLVMVGEACGLTTLTRKLFADSGTELRPYVGEADSYRSVEDWAHLGLGGALLPLSRFRHPEHTREVRDVKGQAIRIQYEALWLTRGTRVTAIETLLDTLLTPP